MRRHGRVSLSSPVAISWVDRNGTNKFMRCRSLDVSITGVRVEAIEPIAQGTSVGVSIQSLALTVNASVKHCEKQKSKWVIGIEFSSSMKSMLGHLAGLPGADAET